MPIPGETMYSDAWMGRNGSEIPMPWRHACRQICRGFDLGNDRDILLVWETIRPTVEQVEKSVAFALGYTRPGLGG